MSYRTHTCNELRIENIGEKVKLSGFIRKIREFGNMTFIDLRDHYGITQIVLNKDFNEIVSELKPESTISVEGTVIERSNKNKNIDTGDIEIEVEDLKILSLSRTNLPFEINEEYQNNKEDLRLEYRYLDLRNNKIHENIKLRSKVLKNSRDIMEEMNFMEIQTPIFSSSSPEGARDYLVPSRLHKGEFYALPQAPQQYKQLLMVSGFDRYYQIAPCFRDEDPRADRSPCEFYQLDFEMAFSEEEDVLKVLEDYSTELFNRSTDKKVDQAPFVRIKYDDAMEKYGIDKPDLRNPLINVNVTDIFIGSDIAMFDNKEIIAIKVPKISGRKIYDRLTDYVKTEEVGAGGLAWFKSDNGEISGSFAKFVNEDLKLKLEEKLGKFEDQTSVFLLADDNLNKLQKMAGLLRIKLGEEFEMIDESRFAFCFIIDFPMYEVDDEGKIDFAHNPFSMPKVSKEEIENIDPLSIKAHQYDLVCNGFEVASGAVRNYDIDMMEKIFKIVGYDADEVKNRFKALYKAFQYGVPPHAGAALGLDRLIMLLAEEKNIREVIAFPKNKKARDLMMGAPSRVSEEQLKELNIQILNDENN